MSVPRRRSRATSRRCWSTGRTRVPWWSTRWRTRTPTSPDRGAPGACDPAPGGIRARSRLLDRVPGVTGREEPLARLADRDPRVDAGRLVAELVPPPRFGDVRFE